MNNYIEYNDRIAFHPGYYIKEIVDESGLTQEDLRLFQVLCKHKKLI